MTAIPAAPGASSLTLICDHCGRAYPDTGTEWLVLWRAATAAGWDGRDRAVGPHRCDACG
ncbi:hypothetical protein [Saccharothrix syringae]|uniref:Uncharacterized protein n=1 Tax=Saccharothrix syringae TaxID=103733 RepID=A0A5Q0H198_SACSY|nr:hypothetical protein [Saccharothrix syringae]QFZ19873.1 hypothetical protein EKG83_22760 [Saccharothrix syringae]